jgi:hypothetical protein
MLHDMKNILFYGASVTHQTGKSGYFDNLDNKIFNNMRMSYPSSQFHNAGFYNIPRIKYLTEIPDVIFFEWSTTGENIFDLDKLKHMICELSYNKITPIFLLLPKKETYKFNRPCDEQLYLLSAEFKIALLDLRYLINEVNVEEVLRDGVHTTEAGAKLYADAINSFLKVQTFSSPELENLKINYNYHIKIIDKKLELCEGQTLKFKFDSYAEFSEIAISHIVGPHTPIIEYISDGAIIGVQNFFDPWCYYERVLFSTLVPHSVFKKISSKSLDLRISSESPDFSITKTGEIFKVPRRIDINSIFTCNLENFSLSTS